ncbi:MAG TPA: glycosyltransferase family 39 protein [Pseudonocardiaceae bacterium]|nr:glycosyltransferase family 39 protein [Pseudonocardiaceae bacterium]
MSASTLSPPVPVVAAEATRPSRPVAVRVALAVLLAGTAVLYLWNLSASGYANDFYAAAVEAGTRSWKALLFGSLDPGNAITVDKPPAALWVIGLSGRIFGFSSWSLLAPQAIEGVLSVWLLFAAVRRWSGPAAGLLAGAVLALTPVAALMFRFDNPDALLVLLMVAGAYCVVRAVERASVGWLVLAGTALGFGFLTKMLQAFLVLPAFALVYLLAANTSLGRRIAHLAAAGLAVVVSAGWYVALVALWPAGSRPYIGGSTGNSLLELALGYNGLGRIFGGTGNGGGGGGAGFGGGNTGFGGATGITRLFGASMGTEISWLLPAALIGLVAGLWFTRHTPRTDRTRAALLLWGGWLLVTGLVFSYMQGVMHPYYTVALAPAIAALVAIAGRELWRGRDLFACRVALALMIAVTGVWDYALLVRTSDWLPALRWLLLLAAGVATFAVLLGGRLTTRVGAVVATVALTAGLLGTAAYAVDTASNPHSGAIPTSGPSTGGFGGGPGGGVTNTAVANLLTGSTYRWAAATVGSQTAGTLELSTGASVMAIGGFTGSDDSPTLAQFQAYVQAGQVHYFITGGQGGGGGAASQIASWVASHFTSTTVGGETVYDLTKAN